MDAHHHSLNRSTTSPRPVSGLHRAITPSQDITCPASKYSPNLNHSKAKLDSELDSLLARGNGTPNDPMSPSVQMPYPDSSGFAYSHVDSKDLGFNNFDGGLLASRPSSLHTGFTSFNHGPRLSSNYEMTTSTDNSHSNSGVIGIYSDANTNIKELSSMTPMQSTFNNINSVPAEPLQLQYHQHDVQYTSSQVHSGFVVKSDTLLPVASGNSGSYIETYPAKLQQCRVNSPVLDVSGQINSRMDPKATTTRYQNLKDGMSVILSPEDTLHESHTPVIEEPMDSNIHPRQKTRPDSQQVIERNLLALANSVSSFSLAETALKIKRMETNSAELGNDPILGKLCNSKDIRHDRHHQVFALAWINQSCEVSPASVIPRNRIYARYVQMCGECTLNPLMPSAFGRFVRISFPNLTTRRLGMRGKSKYHYCGVRLKGDRSQVSSPLSSYSSVALDSPQPGSFYTPSHTVSTGSLSMFSTPMGFVNVQDHFLINDFKYVPRLYEMIEQSISEEHEQSGLNLPSIHLYLSKDSDYDSDIADTLHALVKIQCTSIFESIRYMKKDDLFRALVPSPVLLTGSSFKLIDTDLALEWVKDCDLVTYRAMLKLLSRLHLKGSSKEIIAILHEITSGYVNILSAALGERFSQNYKTMKLKLARQFIKLVSRLLRCIETGTRAAIVLSSTNDRNLMLSDWSKLNFHDTVLREIPCGADISQAIIKILEIQVVRLLQDATPGPTLAKYADFLFELPSLFSSVNPWLFSLLLSNLLTGFIREMSMVGSRSFKLWWIVGCWVNEYMSWSFELGGYLHDELYSSNETASRISAMDLGLGINLNANTDFHALDKNFSVVDLLGDPHDS